MACPRRLPTHLGIGSDRRQRKPSDGALIPDRGSRRSEVSGQAESDAEEITRSRASGGRLTRTRRQLSPLQTQRTTRRLLALPGPSEPLSRSLTRSPLMSVPRGSRVICSQTRGPRRWPRCEPEGKVRRRKEGGKKKQNTTR